MNNVKALKAALVLRGETAKELASMLGISYQALNYKCKGRYSFKDYELAFIMKRYDFTPAEIVAMFLEGVGDEDDKRVNWYAAKNISERNGEDFE